MGKNREGAVPIIDTSDKTAGFEDYKEELSPELAGKDYAAVQREIAAYYSVPEANIFSVEVGGADPVRTQRAFSVVILENGNRYYIDGYTAHVKLLQALQRDHGVEFEIGGDHNESVHGFLDPDGFADYKAVVEAAAEHGLDNIKWFVRYTTTPDSPQNSLPKIPDSPVEIA